MEAIVGSWDLSQVLTLWIYISEEFTGYSFFHASFSGTLGYHAASVASCSLACYLYLAGRKMDQRVHKKAMHLEHLQERSPRNIDFIL